MTMATVPPLPRTTQLPGVGIAEAIAGQGFAIVTDVLSSGVVERLLSLLASSAKRSSPNNDDDGLYAIRNVAELIPQIHAVAKDAAIRALIEPIAGQEAFLVRSLFFDKTARANWKVAWHQDRSIAVEERVDVAGFGPWSVKGGIVHVGPPVEILQDMLTLRLHLDDCDEDNGPLRVIPGSHLKGRLTAKQIREEVARQPQVSCAVAARGALVIRPLLLHASAAARSPRHRRVLHLEFASCRLPAGLRWACASGANEE